MTLELDASDGLGVPPAVLRLSTADLMRFLRATEQKSIRWTTAKVSQQLILHSTRILTHFNAYMLICSYVYVWYVRTHMAYVCMYVRACVRAYIFMRCNYKHHTTHHDMHTVCQPYRLRIPYFLIKFSVRARS